jgi:hypothetical protein
MSITKDSILTLIAQKDAAVVKAIKALVNNRVKMKDADDEFIHSVFHALPKWNDHMTPRQHARARRILPTYADDLLRIAVQKEALRDAAAEHKPVSNTIATYAGRF